DDGNAAARLSRRRRRCTAAGAPRRTLLLPPPPPAALLASGADAAAAAVSGSTLLPAAAAAGRSKLQRRRLRGFRSFGRGRSAAARAAAAVTSAIRVANPAAAAASPAFLEDRARVLQDHNRSTANALICNQVDDDPPCCRRLTNHQSQMLSKSDLENVRSDSHLRDCRPLASSPLSPEGRSACSLDTLLQTSMRRESYLCKAAISELRTELQIHRRNDTANLRSDVNAVMREVDALHIKLREDMANLKSDIAMEMNARKAEMRESVKKAESAILEANNRYTVALSDVRTEIEAMKWHTCRERPSVGGAPSATKFLTIDLQRFHDLRSQIAWLNFGFLSSETKQHIPCPFSHYSSVPFLHGPLGRFPPFLVFGTGAREVYTVVSAVVAQAGGARGGRARFWHPHELHQSP
ncbi:MAG: hypothetical protein BJ554DRAFT_1264, partial [Olpidium bornovanus]